MVDVEDDSCNQTSVKTHSFYFRETRTCDRRSASVIGKPAAARKFGE